MEENNSREEYVHFIAGQEPIFFGTFQCCRYFRDSAGDKFI